MNVRVHAPSSGPFLQHPLKLSLLLLLIGSAAPLDAQDLTDDKFRQLEEVLPTPNTYRTASGAPGRGYWQQRADYVIDVELDDERQRILGTERITYQNHSPDTLKYLWLQLDANIFAPDSDAALTATAPNLDGSVSYKRLQSLLVRETFDGGVKITSVRDASNQPLRHKHPHE